MARTLKQLLPLALLVNCATGSCSWATDTAELVTHLQDLTTVQLEQRLAKIDEQLGSLARYSMRGGVGAIGYRSSHYEEAGNTEWIQIDLEQEVPIDAVVLVPTIWRDTAVGFKDDGFPIVFEVLAGNREEPDGVVISKCSAADRLLPRVAPVVLPCPGVKASWVRIEATHLTPRAWDGRHILQLSEILVFNGDENVALQKPVQVSSPDSVNTSARRREFLVDGFVPYLMDAQQGTHSIAFLGKPNSSGPFSLTIDLQATYSLNRIHLHSLDLSDTVPQSPVDLGIPRRMLVEGATHSDFSDAVQLIEYRMDSIFDVGPIIMRPFPDAPCRYVRLSVTEPYVADSESAYAGLALLGFAEIEVFSEGRNVALGKSVSTTNLERLNRERSLSALTDGRNLYGQILPVREWLDELALRHDLEVERPLIFAELGLRYQRQSTHLTALIWLTVLLGAGFVFTILVDRNLRMRQVARIKARLAADLHDELGANFHTIGLLSDLAEEANNASEDLSALHQRIRDVTERTGAAIRHCTNMLEADGLHTGMLVADMQRASNRIMAKLDHEILIEGEQFLEQLKSQSCFDLFMFYKECLVNISRHSGATEFSTQLKATPTGVHLTICDNGRGLEDFSAAGIPASLKRRARLLGAKVTVERSAGGGTCINLRLRTRGWGRFKWV